MPYWYPLCMNPPTREPRSREEIALARESDSSSPPFLSGAERVTDAIYDAGFSGASRFYAASEGRLGMTPSAWRDGGRGVRIGWSVVSTSLGPMLVAATDKGVCRLSFNETRDEVVFERFEVAWRADGPQG